MNDTKWDELRLLMYNLGGQSPLFRIKDLGRDELWEWDGEWFYHFRLLPYRSIEWVDLRLRREADRPIVRDRLRQVRLPGIETEEGFRIVGWIQPGDAVRYI